MSLLSNFLNNRQGFILVAVTFMLYCNTVQHQYALDDILVIENNSFVKQGIKGIPKILTTDFFFGYEGIENDLSGGRYRPLSLVIFAIEYQLFGSNPLVSHLINVCCYCLLIVLVFRFLRKYAFQKQPIIAFLTALFFSVHPIHTEVVSNVKSRDEIIALLLIIGSLSLLFRYLRESKKAGALVGSLICFFLALLTKESSITFLGVIPFLLVCFQGEKIVPALRKTIPFGAVVIGYLALRYAIVGFKTSIAHDIMNAPYLYATTSEALATKVLIMGKYLQLLCYPHPMVYDYSFNQIPYINFYHPMFWVALIGNVGLIVIGLLLIKKKPTIGFGILYYFITLSIVTNFVVDIGAPMADRLLFQPSLGFCLIIGYLF